MTDIRPPFGTYGLPLPLERLRLFASSFPENRLGRLAVSAARRLCMIGRPSPIDVEVYPTVNARVYPKTNRCEKRVLVGPQFFDLPERRHFTTAILNTKATQPFHFLDLGANVGMYSLWIVSELRRLDRNGRILAVEPDTTTRARLEANISASSAGELIRIAACGVGGTSGKARMVEDTRNRGGNHIDVVGSDDADGEVLFDVKTIPEICDEFGFDKLDAVKIDVEGHDMAALGALFDSGRSELFPTWIQAEVGRNSGDTELVRLCEANGYRTVARTKLNIIMQQTADLAAGGEKSDV